MIKAIIFDYLGVLVHGFDEFYKKIAETSEKSKEKVKKVFSEHWQLLKVGKITDDEFWERMKKALEIPSEKIKYLKLFVVNLLTVNKETMNNVKKLAEKYELCLLSNACYGWSEVSFNKNGLKPYFKKAFFSHNLGLAKPDERIYMHVLKEIRHAPEEVLFVDDSQKNVEAAQKVGLKAVQFQNWKDFLESIAKKQK